MRRRFWLLKIRKAARTGVLTAGFSWLPDSFEYQNMKSALIIDGYNKKSGGCPDSSCGTPHRFSVVGGWDHLASYWRTKPLTDRNDYYLG